MYKKTAILVVFLVCLFSLPYAESASRVALVIGNSDYKIGALKNPVNDANDIAEVLSNLGFEVILKKNVDRREMVAAIRSFGKKLSGSQIGFFYYAGHGVQIDGANYLIPVKINFQEEYEVEFEAVQVTRIFQAIKSAGNATNIVILDACRDNPFKKSTRKFAKGLARMDAPRGTMLAYATAAGHVAADGTGRNGTYTEALLRNLQDPNLDVRDMFNKTGLDVEKKTNRQQTPWVSNSSFPDFYLAGGSKALSTLTIESNPIGAEIFIHGKFKGKAPVEIKDIAPGGYNVEAKLSGYLTGKNKINITEGEQASLNFSLNHEVLKAKLYVKTSPSNCQVRLLNLKAGFKNGMKLDLGRYTLAVTKKGYESKIQWVDMISLEDVKVYVKLEKRASVIIKSKLYVKTSPPGSSVKILNSNKKFYNGIELDQGRYSLEVSQKGYKTDTRWVIVTTKDTDLYFDLEKLAPVVLKSKLYVSTIPQDAKVQIINIKEKYHSGIELSFGLYKIKVSAPNFESITKWEKITSSQAVKLKIELRKIKSKIPISITNIMEEFETGNYFALIIGINNYQTIKPLETPIHDAEALKDTLKHQYGFQVTLLKDATRYKILTALNNFRAKLTLQDNLLIYYAGHGWLDKDTNEGYWLPIDSEADNPANWIANSSITNSLKAIKAKHVLVVSDSCYSGTLARDIKVNFRSSDYLKRISKKRARTVIASGGLEPVSDSGGGRNHSVFATALIEALESNNTKVIETSRLFINIRRTVILNSDQTPEYSDIRKAGHEGGEFLFVKQKILKNQSVKVASISPADKESNIVARDDQYVKYSNDIVYDKNTGLEWYIGSQGNSGQVLTLRLWVENLMIDGGKWRLPSTRELKSLCSEIETNRYLPLLKVCNSLLLTNRQHPSGMSSWGYTLKNNTHYILVSDDYYPKVRAVAVRSRK